MSSPSREVVAKRLFWALVGIVVVSGIVAWVVFAGGPRSSEGEPTLEQQIEATVTAIEATVVAGLEPEDLDGVISSCSEAQELILAAGEPGVPGRYVKEAEDYYLAHC